MRKDLVASAILLCIAALYYWASTFISASSLEDEVGPRGLPNVLAVLLAMVAIVIGDFMFLLLREHGRTLRNLFVSPLNRFA